MSVQDLTLERIFSAPDINGQLPLQLKFAPDGSRVSYLKAAIDDPQQLDLWSFDPVTQVERCLVAAKDLASDRSLSDAEKARRERLRIFQSGIVEYYWSPDSAALLFPLEGNLYLYRLGADDPLTQLTDGATFETDIRFSPDGQFISFVRDQNLYLIRLDSGQEQQLTDDGGGSVSNGLAEFIAQEEMHRFEGYWWSPDSSRIAFTRVDESPVDVSQRYEIDADTFGVYDQRYPFAGRPNADVRVAVVDLDSRDVSWSDISSQGDRYVARLNWFKDSQHLAIQTQSRNQQLLQLHKWRCGDTSELLLEETSNSWINLNNNFTSLDDGRFIWGSEQDGFNHLYLKSATGNTIQQLTAGAWIVADVRGVSADAAVLFDGYHDTPLEKHLYRVSIDHPGAPQRLTRPGASHQVEMSRDLKWFIDRSSSALTPPEVTLRRTDSADEAVTLSRNVLDRQHPFFPWRNSRGEVSFATLPASDGQLLHYRLMAPANRQPGVRYPVIITVYGGPGVQRVTNEWIPPWNHYMTQRGYGLIQLDNRGSANRGKKFESAIFHQLGDVEVEDQLKAVEFLDGLDWVDSERLGVFGHSYGGYMTLMMMMKSQHFKAGVSVAPVTDWRLYDTHYTERYLGHPDDNPEGFDASSVFPYASRLAGKLLLVHGMADDNVLFTNSTRLYKTLQDNNTDFEIMTYPGAKHGLAGRATNLHRYGMMDRFFDRHLKAPRE